MKMVIFSFPKSYFLKPILILLCWCLCTNLAAQPSMIDSLERVLATGVIAGEEKMELLLTLSSAYHNVDAVKSREYALELLQLAKNSGSRLVEARAYNLIGISYRREKSFFRAHTNFINAVNIYRELDNMVRLRIVYYNMLAMYYDLEDDDNIVYYANKVLAINVEQENWQFRLLIKSMLSKVLFRGNYSQEALDYFLNFHQRALHVEDSVGLDCEVSSLAAGRIANTYIHMNRPSEALPYIYQALACNDVLEGGGDLKSMLY